MEVDAVTLIIVLIIIILGFYFKQLWISLIFVAVLFVLLLATRSKKAPSASVPTGGGARVRPIIVKRKYTGPESIYPKKMVIKYTPKWPSDWREYGPEPVGKAIGSFGRWLKNLFK